MKIGKALREKRKVVGYTLAELSEKTNFSIGYLSNIERDIASPSLDNLELICKVLRTTVNDVINWDTTDTMVLDSNDRKLLYSDVDGRLWSAVSDNPYVRATIHYMDKDFTDYIEHPGLAFPVFGYVISGELNMVLDGQEYHMKKKDTVIVPVDTTHKFKRIGDEEVITLWVYPNSEWKNGRED